MSKVSVDDDRNLDSLPNNDLVKIRIHVYILISGECNPSWERNASKRNFTYFPFLFKFYTRMKTATKGAVGLPLAVQVVGRRFDEETVLRVMKEVEGLVKYERK